MDPGQGYHGITYIFKVGEKMIECNRGCGAENLHWKIVNCKYKLFQNNNLLHMCNDGVKSNKAEMKRVTNNILEELGLSDPSDIPVAEVYEKNDKKINPVVLKSRADLSGTNIRRLIQNDGNWKDLVPDGTKNVL